MHEAVGVRYINSGTLGGLEILRESLCRLARLASDAPNEDRTHQTRIVRGAQQGAWCSPRRACYASAALGGGITHTANPCMSIRPGCGDGVQSMASSTRANSRAGRCLPTHARFGVALLNNCVCVSYPPGHGGRKPYFDAAFVGKLNALNVFCLAVRTCVILDQRPLYPYYPPPVPLPHLWRHILPEFQG